MAKFLQIVLINLVVSCDNVGVIALATRGLPDKKAVRVRRAGIGLSLVLKVVFIALIGSMLQVTWLHIRIIGGVMLLYVTFQMMGAHGQEQAPARAGREADGANSVIRAVVAIIAADIGMSLDNVVAILGVACAEGAPLDTRAYLMVVGGLVVCMPLLMWCSGTIAGLMERFPLLTNLCAGYLVYTAINIMAEDESVRLFCQAANFTFLSPAAVLCGGLMVLYGCLGGRAGQTKVARWGSLSLYVFVTVSALLMVAGASFLSTVPLDRLDSPVPRILLAKLQSGAGAVHLLGMESEVLCFCAALMAGMRARRAQSDVRAVFFENLKGTGALTLVYFTVVTAGFTYTFGFGERPLAAWIAHALLLSSLLLTYPAVFTLLALLTRNRRMSVLLGLVYLFVESVVTAVSFLHDGLRPFAGLLPKYYLSSALFVPLTPMLGVRIVLLCALIIAGCYAAVRRIEDRRAPGGLPARAQRARI